ncbi:MAG: peptidoglycan editing factor PgeF [Burkholderiaceae bacterium]|nr:peptidoglycan editing factor PgeF [Burkholderiaceae bacterium]
MTFHPDWLRPAWQTEGVQAVMTTRHGGVSEGPYASMNLRDGVGDDPRCVARNQSGLAELVGATPVYLNQVHGRCVVRLTTADVAPDAALHDADACITTDIGVACTVQVADCMPALFAAPGAVGAAHAGWRGLAGGVLEATLDALCVAVRCQPDQVEVWLGPCIGPGRFEVGVDVLRAFGFDPAVPVQTGDPQQTPRFKPLKSGKWLANLPDLARDRLTAAGVASISGGTWCTASDASRFFSFRRDGVTGRMVAAIWRTR